ncbi:MAG: HEAT repeat domain-containing protein [Chloroflexi bacterium]|nr:HEAT repeat domain-containing protein [Chloroflexota bacterium]
MTRCLGLTDERRRCAALPMNGTGYCARHRPANFVNESVRAEPGFVRRWLAPFRPRAFTAVVRDDVKLPVPRTMRHRSFDFIVEQLLRGADSTTRWSAAYALRRRRELAALEPLWHVLHHERVALVRQQAAVALGKIGTRMVVSPLVEALWHDVDPGVRHVCAIALGNLGEPTAARDLADALAREHAIFVRWDCVLALGQLGDRAFEPLLVELAQTERTDVIRRACQDALAQMRLRQA